MKMDGKFTHSIHSPHHRYRFPNVVTLTDCLLCNVAINLLRFRRLLPAMYCVAALPLLILGFLYSTFYFTIQEIPHNIFSVYMCMKKNYSSLTNDDDEQPFARNIFCI